MKNKSEIKLCCRLAQLVKDNVLFTVQGIWVYERDFKAAKLK